ncbi:MAG: hypothetical protein RLZZ134_4 [Pseudomonadota bacterium]|jgi:hypothetical protein
MIFDATGLRRFAFDDWGLRAEGPRRQFLRATQ